MNERNHNDSTERRMHDSGNHDGVDRRITILENKTSLANRLDSLTGWRSLVLKGASLIAILFAVLFSYVFVYYPTVYAKSADVAEVKDENKVLKGDIIASLNRIETKQTTMDVKLDTAINVGNVNKTKIEAVEKNQDRHDKEIGRLRDKLLNKD